MENLEYELYLGQFMKQKTLISEEWNCRGVGSKKQKWWYMVLNVPHYTLFVPKYETRTLLSEPENVLSLSSMDNRHQKHYKISGVNNVSNFRTFYNPFRFCNSFDMG